MQEEQMTNSSAVVEHCAVDTMSIWPIRDGIRINYGALVKDDALSFCCDICALDCRTGKV